MWVICMYDKLVEYYNARLKNSLFSREIWTNDEIATCVQFFFGLDIDGNFSDGK